MGFQSLLKTRWDIQPSELSNYWILGCLFIASTPEKYDCHRHGMLSKYWSEHITQAFGKSSFREKKNVEALNTDLREWYGLYLKALSLMMPCKTHCENWWEPFLMFEIQMKKNSWPKDIIHHFVMEQVFLSINHQINVTNSQNSRYNSI